METHSQTPLLPLFLVSILAFIVPIFTSWFSKKSKIPIPTVAGEIICGIIIGKSFLGLIESTDTIPWLDFLSLFGFTYLMFLSGLEVDINVLTNKCPECKTVPNNKSAASPVFLGFSHFVLTILLSSLISLILYHSKIISSWEMMTLILSTTSVSIVVPVLKEKLLSKTILGQTILLSALIADLLTMVLITLFIAISVSGKPSFTILSIILFIGIGTVIYRLHISKIFDGMITKLFVLRPFLSELAHTTTQIKVRGAIAIMILFIVASQALGFEVILGAFLAGILTTLILGEEKTDQLEMKLDAIGYGFFIPIFFLSVGINLDLKVFFASKSAWILLIFLIVSAFIIKVVPSLIFALRFKLKEALSAGVLLSSRLSLIIAASTIGLKEGFITEEINAAIVMVAVISCIISPVIFNRLTEQKQKQSKKENILIIGSNIVARILSERILEHTDKVKLISMGEEEHNDAAIRGLPVERQLGNIQETLIKAGINNTNTLVLTTEDDSFNFDTAMLAKNAFATSNVVAVVNKVSLRDKFRENNIRTVTPVYTIMDKLLSKAIFPLSEYHATIGENELDIVDLVVLNPEFDGKMVREINLPEGTSIAYIIREDESIVPHDDTIIYLNDHLTIIGSYEDTQSCCSIISSRVM